MVTTNEVLNALHEALGNATDNLPDVVGDPNFSAVAECCADVAALSHLLGNDATGTPRLAAYLA